MPLKIMQPSCSKCFYASWETEEDWESFDGRKEYEIVCAYPSKGDLSDAKSMRHEIIDNWHDSTVEEASNCESFTYYSSQNHAIS